MRPSDIAAELAKAEIAAQRAIVIEPETDEILLAKNADVRGQVASTQKLLSALVIALEGHLNSAVTILPEDRACDPSFLAIQLGLSAYETYSRRDLLIGMLVGSANDAASALARDVAGSVPRFVERMNDLAADLGLSNSRFANPTGLPDERQFSTARDMAKLAEAVDATASLRKIVSLQRFSVLKSDGTAIEIRTTNRLLKSCSNCDGMKTGFTRSAGYCLVSSGGTVAHRRLVVILNSARNEVWTDSKRLLEWGRSGDVGRRGDSSRT